MLLGIDVSTTRTGFAIVSDSKEALLLSHVKLNRVSLKSLYQKADVVKEELLRIRGMFDVTEVGIEQSLLRLGRGMSNAHTIALLQRFNGMVSLIAYRVYGIEPVLYDARSARKSIGIEVHKGGDSKKIVTEYLVGMGYKPTNHDEADALVVGLAAVVAR